MGIGTVKKRTFTHMHKKENEAAEIQYGCAGTLSIVKGINKKLLFNSNTKSNTMFLNLPQSDISE